MRFEQMASRDVNGRLTNAFFNRDAAPWKSILTLLFCAFVTTGARSELTATNAADLANMGKALDRGMKLIEEYGTAHISSPVLTEPFRDSFFDNFKYGMSNYFNDARTDVQGSGALFEQVSTLLSLRGTFQMDDMTRIQQTDALRLQQDVSQLNQTKLYHVTNSLQMQYDAEVQAAKTNSDPVISSNLIAAAYKRFTDAFPGQITNSVTSVSGTLSNLFGPNAAPRPSNTNVLTAQQFTGFQGISSNSSKPKISNRTALITAAGDAAVEAIFRVIGDRDQARSFSNRRVLFGLTTVSVNPGWRTQRDWACEVTIYAELEYAPARLETIKRIVDLDSTIPNSFKDWIEASQLFPRTKLDASGGWYEPPDFTVFDDKQTNSTMEAANPYYALSNAVPTIPMGRKYDAARSKGPVLVTAISPLNDAETFDLSSSQRQQKETALALAFVLQYLGRSGEAEAFANFVKRREFDLATRTPLVAVNTMSSSEGMFGFQIGPRPRGIASPGNKKSGPGTVLERQSFPALLLFGVGERDLDPTFEIITNSAHRREVRVYEPEVVLRQFRRWIPMNKSTFVTGDWKKLQNWGNPRFSEVDRFRIISDIEKSKDTLFAKLPENAIRGFSNVIQGRIKIVEDQLFGSESRLNLNPSAIVADPARGNPVIFGVSPSFVISPPTNTTRALIRLSGDRFSELDFNQLTLVGANFVFRRLGYERQTGDGYIVEVEITNSPAEFAFRVPYADDTNNFAVVSPTVRVEQQAISAWVPRMPSIASWSPTNICLKVDTNGIPIQRYFTIEFRGTNLAKVVTYRVGIVNGFGDVKLLQNGADKLVVEVEVPQSAELRENIGIEFPFSDYDLNPLLVRIPIVICETNVVSAPKPINPPHSTNGVPQ